MRAFNCECQCGEKGDRIFKGNDVVHCHKCGQVMRKLLGPIGGSDILPLSPGQPDRFIPFMSETLKRMVTTPEEMTAAYNEMYGVKFVGGAAPVKPQPKPIVDEVDDDEKEDEDEDKEEVGNGEEEKLPEEAAAPFRPKTGEYKKVHANLFSPKKRGRPRKVADENV